MKNKTTYELLNTIKLLDKKVNLYELKRELIKQELKKREKENTNGNRTRYNKEINSRVNC